MGERHNLHFRVTGADSAEIVARMCAGLEDAEFGIPGQIVADIAVVSEPMRAADGAIVLNIEALTVGD